MEVQTLLGKKIGQTQKYTPEGIRIPVTMVDMEPNVVVQVKTNDKDGYWALQLGLGSKKAGRKETFRFLQEARAVEAGSEKIEVGQKITLDKVFKVGDIVKVTGTSKGKGFAGVVKRHHFHGGPKTHGQSDRWRAPGSIGSTTTPGRVLKGKRMAGRMGHVKATVKGLKVFGMDNEKNLLFIKGLVPGEKGAIVRVTKE